MPMPLDLAIPALGTFTAHSPKHAPTVAPEPTAGDPRSVGELLVDADHHARTLLLDLARDMKTPSSRAAVAGALVSSTNPTDRASALQMALKWKDEAAYAALRPHRASETDTTVLALYNQIPAAPKPDRKPRSGKSGGKDEQGSPRSGGKPASSKSSARQTSSGKNATPGVGARSRSGR